MEKMVVGFDGKRAVSNMTGLGNYSRLVLESMAQTYPDISLRVYAPRNSENARWGKVRVLPSVTLRLPQKGETPLGSAAWRTWGISKLLLPEKVQLFHGLSNELPLNIRKSGVPSIVTMHDVIYRRLPYCYKPIDRAIYDFKYGRSCRNATHIIAVSERTKLDVMEYYGVPEEKIDVVYQGCDDIFREVWSAERIAAVTHKYGISGRYIIQVGSIERRKNALASVQALSALPGDVSLILIGRGTDYLDEIRKKGEELGVWGRVKVLSGLPFADLPGLYQGAVAAVYPSRYEGFGIPVLEALCSRTPCVAATGSCLEEAGGKGAIYVDPDDSRALGEAVQSIIDSNDLRNYLIKEGEDHAALFNNADIPSRLMDVYFKVLGEEKSRKRG